MTTRIRLFVCAVSLSVLAGCAGTGEVIPISLNPVASQTAMHKKSVALRVAITDFGDERAHQTGLGVRTHLWGGVSYFDVPGGKPPVAATQVLRDYLSAQGWQVVEAGAAGPSPDVTVSGSLVDLTLSAKSGLGFTDITTSTKIMLRASNLADGSTVRLTLNGSGSDRVFWFTPDDAAALINDVLTDSFSKLVRDTVVGNHILRLP